MLLPDPDLPVTMVIGVGFTMGCPRDYGKCRCSPMSGMVSKVVIVLADDGDNLVGAGGFHHHLLQVVFFKQPGDTGQQLEMKVC